MNRPEGLHCPSGDFYVGSIHPALPVRIPMAIPITPARYMAWGWRLRTPLISCRSAVKRALPGRDK